MPSWTPTGLVSGVFYTNGFPPGAGLIPEFSVAPNDQERYVKIFTISPTRSQGPVGVMRNSYRRASAKYLIDAVIAMWWVGIAGAALWPLVCDNDPGR